MFFFHTRKVGLLAGIKFGRGFLIERQSPPGEQPARWSAPVFYTVHEGSFGLTAGALLTRLIMLCSVSPHENHVRTNITDADVAFHARTAGAGFV